VILTQVVEENACELRGYLWPEGMDPPKVSFSKHFDFPCLIDVLSLLPFQLKWVSIGVNWYVIHRC